MAYAVVPDVPCGAGRALPAFALGQQIMTIFASRYTAEISLAELLDPDVIRRCRRAATGEKYLLKPHAD